MSVAAFLEKHSVRVNVISLEVYMLSLVFFFLVLRSCLLVLMPFCVCVGSGGLIAGRLRKVRVGSWRAITSVVVGVAGVRSEWWWGWLACDQINDERGDRVADD